MKSFGFFLVVFVALLACCMPVQGTASMTVTSMPVLLSPGDDITITFNAENPQVENAYWVETNLYIDQDISVYKVAPGCVLTSPGQYYCDDIWVEGVHYQFKGTVKPGTPAGTELKSGGWSAFHYKSTGAPVIVDGSASSYVKTNAPEFPGLAVPVVMIAGLLGAVFLVRRMNNT